MLARIDERVKSIGEDVAEMKKDTSASRENCEGRFVRVHERIDRLEKKQDERHEDTSKEQGRIKARMNFYIGGMLVVATLMQLVVGAVVVSIVRQAVATLVVK